MRRGRKARGRQRRRWAGAAAALAVMAAAAVACPWAEDVQAARFPDADYEIPLPDPGWRPMVGTNYTHHRFAGDCSWNSGGILSTYAAEGVARAVHDQLREKRLAGVESLRLIVWHMRDVGRQTWGAVPSRGGRLSEPYRSSFIAYLTEVRRFGFSRLTISFSPQWANSPLRRNHDPGTFEENWSFLRDVRALALEHGPNEVRFDLLNEGAPSDHLPPAQRARMSSYVQRMWRRYTDAFGGEDATVSVIAPSGPDDQGRRLDNLISILVAARRPLPPWFELHLNYGPEGVTWGLADADAVLRARGLDQPLTIGETSYNDFAVASAIRAFMDRTGREVVEVTQWFRRAGATCDVSPPYEVDAYLGLRDVGAPSHQ